MRTLKIAFQKVAAPFALRKNNNLSKQYGAATSSCTVVRNCEIFILIFILSADETTWEKFESF